ncbi:MAG TPA: hypothetical protein VGM25_01315 [Caulobacteraceae bacterium]|jgi:hypothetical protein
MNYRYVPDAADGVLKAIVTRRPTTTLHDLRQSHPLLRSMSVDHLSLLLERTAERRALSWGR